MAVWIAAGGSSACAQLGCWLVEGELGKKATFAGRKNVRQGLPALALFQILALILMFKRRNYVILTWAEISGSSSVSSHPESPSRPAILGTTSLPTDTYSSTASPQPSTPHSSRRPDHRASVISPLLYVSSANALPPSYPAPPTSPSQSSRRCYANYSLARSDA